MRHRGLTLLELLVAMAILVSLVTLSGALWAQTRSWSQDAARMTDTLRPRQAHELLRAQWDARREHVRLDEHEGASMAATPSRLEFVTARAALFPGWPLVRASYIIEPEGPVGREVFHLVYEERRVTNPDVSTESEFDIAGHETTARMRLLERCDALRWEWYAHFPQPDEGQTGPDAAETPKSGWRPVLPEDDAQRDERLDAAEMRGRRLYAEHEGRRLSWLVVERSH